MCFSLGEERRQPVDMEELLEEDEDTLALHVAEEGRVAADEGDYLLSSVGRGEGGESLRSHLSETHR